MRALLILLAFAFAPFPAAAQVAPTPDITTITRNLAAIWRPLPTAPSGPPDQIFATACTGAVEEMERLIAALPADAGPTTVTGMRTTAGLLFIPAAAPGQIYVFPSPALAPMAGGLGVFTVPDAAQGRLDLTDSSGGAFALQLGRAGGRSMLRILWPERPAQTFVGCASSLD